MSTLDTRLGELVGRNEMLFSAYEQWTDQQTALIAGRLDDPASFNATGGKVPPLGYYPVTNASGQTVYMPCVERQQALSAVPIAALAGVVETKQAGSDVLTRLASAGQAVISRTYINDLGGLVDGPTTLAQAQINAAVIQAAIDAGGVLYIRPGSRISVGGQLSFTKSRGGIVWDGSGLKPKLHMPKEWWNNINPSDNVGGRAALIRVTGGTGATPTTADVRFEGVWIVGDPDGGRYVTGISAMNVRDLRVLGCEISDFPNGMGICAGSLFGDTQIRDNRVRDFYDDSVVALGGAPWSRMVQSSGIELDNNRYSPSVGVLIAGNRIERIMKGTAFASLAVQGGALGMPIGMQTDGINIANATTDGTRVIDNYIDTVDECIDNFGSNGTIANNQLRNAHSHGLKLIHGAQGNTCPGNTILNAGRIGIVMAAAAGVGERSTSRNVVSAGTVSGVGYNGVWEANSAVAAIRFECSPPGVEVYNPTQNAVIGVCVQLDARCPFGWRGDNDANVSLRNDGEAMRFVGTPSRDVISNPVSAGGKYCGAVSLAGSSLYHSNLGAI